MNLVPQFLPPRGFVVARLFSQPCLCCPLVVSASSEAAVQHGMDAHARYVNAKLDRTTDEHFDDVRLDALIDA